MSTNEHLEEVETSEEAPQALDEVGHDADELVGEEVEGDLEEEED